MAKSTKPKKTAKTSKAKTTKKVTSKKASSKSKTVKAQSKTKAVKKVVERPATAKKKKSAKTKTVVTTEVKTSVIQRKPAYSRKDLEFFKQIILEKKKEIIEQLESLRERMLDESSGGFVNENSPYSLHMAEQGTDAFEKEKNYLWAQRETKFLGYLDAALKRIEDGSYGYCIDCGNVIEKGRLEAVPHTQHCVNCKVKFSKK